MRFSSVFPKLSDCSFAFALAVASFTIQPSFIASNAHAEGYHNYGVVLPRKGFKKPAVTSFGGVSHRSGVVLRSNSKHHRRVVPLTAAQQRQIQIDRRNIRVQRQNQIKRVIDSTRRRTSNGRFLTGQERISVLNGQAVQTEIITVTQGSGVRNATGCPSSHNCGYRIYSDGTGPRIITPGVRLGNELPGYDGLNGPKIITLD